MNLVKRLISFGIVIGTMIAIFLIGYLKPYYNWDMIGYIASAYHMDGYSGEELSLRTYKAVEKEVDTQAFRELTTGSYRETVYSDYKALEQQLPFYTIRIAYVGLMRGLNNLGVPYATSSYTISAFFASITVLIAALLLKKFLVPVYFLPFVVILGGLLPLARLSTPDAIACFFSLLALYLITIRNKLFLLIAAALPIFRTDFLILSLLLGAYGYFTGHRAKALVAVLFSAAVYFTINQAMNNYGWLTIFNHTLIGISPYPAEIVFASELKSYLKPYIGAAYALLHHAHGVIYLFAVLVLLPNRFTNLQRDEKAILWIALTFVALHLLAFPAYMDRFFVFSALASLIIVISTMSRSKT